MKQNRVIKFDSKESILKEERSVLVIGVVQSILRSAGPRSRY